MPEDDLQSIGLLRRRLGELEATVNDFGRRLAIMESQGRRPQQQQQQQQERPPLRGTGSLRDPDLAEATQRRQAAYDEANERFPLPISGTREIEPKEGG